MNKNKYGLTAHLSHDGRYFAAGGSLLRLIVGGTLLAVACGAMHVRSGMSRG